MSGKWGAVGAERTAIRQRESSPEQGISKAGNEKVRRAAIELVWSWVRAQPDNQLAQWCVNALRRETPV